MPLAFPANRSTHPEQVVDARAAGRFLAEEAEPRPGLHSGHIPSTFKAAGALAFALHLIGKSDVAVYDGSWSEWGLPGETPVATGPARLAVDA